MIKHLMVAAALAGCSTMASAAYAGSPYNTDSTTDVRPYATHALGTSHTGQAWANSGYTATVNDDAFRTEAMPAPAAVASPQNGTIQAVPQYFYHAEGTMGAH